MYNVNTDKLMARFTGGGRAILVHHKVQCMQHTSDKENSFMHTCYAYVITVQLEFIFIFQKAVYEVMMQIVHVKSLIPKRVFLGG